MLEELFIPDEDKDQEKTISGKPNYYFNVNDLVDEALRITNNLDSENEDLKFRRRKWRPAGTIRVWDDVGVDPSRFNFLGTNNRHHVPLRGTKVRARRWFTTHTGYTNFRGEFSCNGRFRRAANYSIVWERSFAYDIRNGLWGQANYNGPKRKGNWNLTITGGESLRFATIHRAAYRYYFESIDGLKRPGVSTKISYRDKSGSGVNWGNIPYNVIPNINIYGKDNTGSYRTTDDIYSTTIHELGHASHINLMGGIIQYAQVSDIIYESWADCVEWYLTRIEYNYLGNQDYDVPPGDGDNNQDWTTNAGQTYTPLFIDIIDNYNQINDFPNGPDDRISYSSIYTVERFILRNTYGLSSLRANLKTHSRITSSTHANIDLYMDYFNGL